MIKLFKKLLSTRSTISTHAIALAVSFCTSLFLVAYYEDDMHRFYLHAYKSLFIGISNNSFNHMTSGRKIFFSPWISASTAYESSLQILSSSSGKQYNKLCPNVISTSNRLIASSSLSTNKKSLLLPYDISFTYNLVPGFFSSMAQARGSVVTLAAAVCSSDPQKSEYRKLSSLLLKPVFTPVSDGGSLLIDDQSIWYQEYAQGGRMLPTVLNGHLYTLEALSHIISFYPEYHQIYQKSLSSTCLNISKYDNSFWSLYDITYQPGHRSQLASVKYHKTHIRQLRDYAYLFPCADSLESLSNTFSSYLDSPISRLRWLYWAGVNKKTNVIYILLLTPMFSALFILIMSILRLYRADSISE